MLGLPLNYSTVTQYACANYPYTVTYTVFSQYISIASSGGGSGGGSGFGEDPASLAAWSSSMGAQISIALAQDFGNPFDQARPSSDLSLSLATGSAPPTVEIPTSAAAIATTASSVAVKLTVSLRNSLYLFTLFAAECFYFFLC